MPVAPDSLESERTSPVAQSLAREDRVAPEPSVVGGILGADDTVSKLSVSRGLIDTRPPDKAARIMRLEARAGLPASYIEANLDEVEKEAARSDFDPEGFRKTNPKFSEWLAANPNHYALAQKDLSFFSGVEKSITALSEGAARVPRMEEMAAIIHKEMDGTISNADRERMKALEAQERQEALAAQTDGTVDYLARQTGYGFRQFLSSAREGAKGAAAGALGGAVAGAPGAIGGATFGGLAAAALYAHRLESAFAYKELSRQVDIDGKPMDPDTSKAVATTVGFANAAIEVASDTLLLKLIPGVGPLVTNALKGQVTKAGVNAAVKAALTVPTQRTAMIAAAKNFVAAPSTEALEEFFQHMVGAAGREAAQSLSGQTFAEDSLKEDVGDGLSQAKDAFTGMLAMSGLGFAAPKYFDTMAQARRAEQAQKFFEGLSQGAESEAFKQLPEKAQEAVAAIAQNGPLENVYVDMDAWDTYWQDKADPREMAAEVMDDNGAAYDEAKATGAPLQIKTERYARKIAPSDHNPFFAAEMRTAPDAMNGREVKEFFQAGQAQEKTAQAEDEPTKQVREEVTKTLTGLGFEPSVAEKYGTAYGSHYRARAQRRRRGESAMDLYKATGLQVQREDLPAGAPAAREFEQATPTAPPFYSKLIKTVEEKMGNAATVEQVRGLTKEIKAEERKWLGLDEYLNGKEKVSKAELLDFLRANQVEVKELAKVDGGSNAEPSMRDAKEFFGITDSDWNAKTLQEKEAYRQEMLEKRPTFGAARYGKKAGDRLVLPGGDNYREVLFTLPAKKGTEVLRIEPSTERTGEYDVIDYHGRIRFSGTTEQSAKDYVAEELEMGRVTPSNSTDPEFNSPHWDEPNVLAFVRLTDRTDSDGKKVLFVEEVQSDWHQQGRKRGYKGDKPPASLEDLEWEKTTEQLRLPYRAEDGQDLLKDVMADVYTATTEDGDSITVIYNPLENTFKYGGGGVAFDTLAEAQAAAVEKLNATNRRIDDGVPDAPFRKTWHEFALKRIIRMAAEGGYDRIAWTTGEQQAERYDLSTKIQSIMYEKTESGDYELSVRDTGGNPVDLPKETYTAEELDDVVGKELADKIRKGEGKKRRGSDERFFEGLDLKVGGEGMKGFYDKIIPDFLRKFGKKYGATIGTVAIGDVAPSTGAWELSYTTNEGERATQGFNTEEDAREWLDNTRHSSPGFIEDADIHQAGKTYAVVDPDGKLIEGGFQSQELAQDFLDSEVGVPGAKVVSDVAPTKVHALDITPALKKAALEQGFELFQEKRGRITFRAGGVTITLGAGQDLSTFLHESGHLWLEELMEDAFAEGTPQAIRDDLDKLLGWMGVEARTKDGYRAVREAIGRDQHEQFARGIEAYFREGKAPTADLRGAFAAFRSWLVNIYRNLKSLNVDLNDDVRGVMDRILAADDEIEAAQAEQSIAPLFADPEAYGMSAEEATRYIRAVGEARATATTELVGRMTDQANRAHTRWWKDRREEVRAEVAAEVAQRKEQIAFSVLSRGTLPDGSDLPIDQTGGFSPANLKAIKLDKIAIQTQFDDGPERLKKLPRPHVYKRDGIHPDIAAQMLGFSSGDELLTALEKVEKFDVVVDRETEEQMRERFGDMLVDGTLREEAREALHTTERAKLLRLELQHLASENLPALKGLVRRITKPIPKNEDVRAFAEETIARKKVRDLTPGVYLRAERSAAKEATESLLAGDLEAAFTAKMRELFNHELYRAAVQAKDGSEKAVEYLERFSKPSVRKAVGKAGPSYLEQIDGILERIDLKRRSLRALDKRKSFAEWVAEQRAQGFEPVVPDNFVEGAGLTNYKDMTVEAMRGVTDAVKNIEHLARLKSKLLKVAKQREVDEAIADATASIEANSKGQVKAPLEPTLAPEQRKRGVVGFFAAHRKFANFIRQMDGWKDGGVMWELFTRPANEAADREAVMMEKATEALSALFGLYSKKDVVFDFHRKVFIPEIDASLTKMGQLTVALNWGNLDSRQKLMDGRGWNESQVQAILDRLDARDWKFVSGVWGFLESYWPEIKALNERVDGVAPGKVEPAPVTTKHGTFPGGYYPLKYDPVSSPKAYAHEAQEAVDNAKRGAAVRASTRHGHRKSRVEGVQRAVRLDFGVLFEHVGSVIHDLSHYEYLIDANRLLGDRRMQRVILDNYGDIVYGELRDSLTDIAAGSVPATSALERAANHLRAGVSISAMAFSINTALQQPFGLTQSMVRVGPKWVVQGLGRWIGDAARMESTTAWIFGKSDFMRLRAKTFMREVSEIRNRLSMRGVVLGDMEDSYFYLTAKLQLVADIPTWIGAYEKAIVAEPMDEAKAVALADQAVIDAQGSGHIKDLAKVQRGSGLQKIWTSFYSYFSVTYNLIRESVGRTEATPASVGRLAVDVLMLTVVPALLARLAVKAARGDEPEKDWMKWALKETGTYLLGTVVGVREFSAAVQGFRGYEGPPGTRLFSEAAKAAKQVSSGKGNSEALWKSLNQTGGILFHYPASQVERTVRGLQKLSSGEEKNPMILFTGPPPKRK